MNDRNYSNQFRFALYQEEVLLGEKMFDADVFNPFTRYSIDIRELLPQAITRFQKVLSKKKYDTQLNEYDLFAEQKKFLEQFPYEVRNQLRYNPKPVRHEIEDKVIKGVECKIGLYINENPIVERIFYVDGFNSVSRFSTDVLETVVDTADQIFALIKKNDIQNMWDDYDLINVKGLSINQIRELSPNKRAYLLRNIRRY
jgi:hypothetical protein